MSGRGRSVLSVLLADVAGLFSISGFSKASMASAENTGGIFSPDRGALSGGAVRPSLEPGRVAALWRVGSAWAPPGVDCNISSMAWAEKGGVPFFSVVASLAVVETFSTLDEGRVCAVRLVGFACVPTDVDFKRSSPAWPWPGVGGVSFFLVVAPLAVVEALSTRDEGRVSALRFIEPAVPLPCEGCRKDSLCLVEVDACFVSPRLGCVRWAGASAGSSKRSLMPVLRGIPRLLSLGGAGAVVGDLEPGRVFGPGLGAISERAFSSAADVGLVWSCGSALVAGLDDAGLVPVFSSGLAVRFGRVGTDALAVSP